MPKEPDFTATNGFTIQFPDDGEVGINIDNLYVGPEYLEAFMQWIESKYEEAEDENV